MFFTKYNFLFILTLCFSFFTGLSGATGQTDKRIRHVLIYDNPAYLEPQVISNIERHKSNSGISYVGYGELEYPDELSAVIAPFMGGPFLSDYAETLELALEEYFRNKGKPLDVFIPNQSRAQEYLRLVIEGVAINVREPVARPSSRVAQAVVSASPPAVVRRTSSEPRR